jgi:hypothetical protein
MAIQSIQVMKSSPMWKKLDKETKYDFLGISDKQRLEIDKNRQKRSKKKIVVDNDDLSE